MNIIIFLIILVIILCIFNKQKFSNIKPNSIPNIIPNVIHKIYITDNKNENLNNIEKGVLSAIDSWKNLNPGYILKIYFGEDCINYLKNNFTQEHIDCFNNLKPYAYKADFMRYCILYNEGGWYTDIQQKLLVPLDKINDKNYEWVSCYDETGQENKIKKCMQNSFIGSNKNNKILEQAIIKIIENVKNNYYGDGPWSVTGPCLLGSIFNKDKDKYKILLGFTYNDLKDGPCFNINGLKVIINKCCISTNIPGSSFKNGNNYVELWKQKNVYVNKNSKESFGKTKFGKESNGKEKFGKAKDICILLTTCVNIKTSYYNKNNTPEVRFNIYKDVIDKWLKNTGFDIKIVESSNYKFKEYLDNPRVEIYSFSSKSKYNCRACEATPYEAESILLAFKNLNLKKYDKIIKVTGKYYLPRFEEIVKTISPECDIFLQYTNHPEWQMQNSEFFGCKTIYLEEIMNLILRNSESNMNFESTLYTLIDGKKYKICRFPKIQLEKPVLRSGDNSYIDAL
jgi:hypothetical protein